MREIRFGVLNIVATPHPRGTYEDLLNQVAGKIVNYWGDFHATITAPREVDDDILQGRIVTWTKIDEEEPAIDLEHLSEISLDEIDFEIPENIGFNGRVFIYTFHNRVHRLFFEMRNEFGKNLGAGRAEKLFARLFARRNLKNGSPFVEVTAEPDEDMVERLLGLHRLDRLTIVLKRPNPEDFGDDADRILGLMEEQNIGSEKRELRRQRGSRRGIELDDDNLTLAHVAAINGHVEGVGKDEDGSRFKGSTKEHPKIIRTVVDDATSIALTAVSIAKEYFSQTRRR